MKIYLLFAILFFVLLYNNEIRENLSVLFSPLSNSELEYDPKIWNKKENNIQKYNNCYAYATNDLRTDRNRKPHPGHLSGIESDEFDYTCPTMEKYVFTDYPDAYKIDYDKPCKCNYFKAFMTVDPKNDFHLYRQDANGYWSHKPGSREVTNIDATGNYIINPEKADREYKKYNYEDSCFFFCVPHNEQNKKDC